MAVKKAKSRASSISRDYHVSLQNFWSGRQRTAIEHLSKLLADDPGRPDQFLLYRLWIEILSDLREESTLRSLNDHLWARSETDPEFRATYMALRGLIFYEMDEINGAELLAKGIASYDDNPYCQELLYLTTQRTAEKKTKCSLLDMKDELVDYCHIQTLARTLTNKKDQKNLETLMNYSQKLYPDAPLALFFRMHMSLENKNFKEAKTFAMKLSEKFPAQMDYCVFAAFAAIKSGDSTKATELLEKAIQLGAEHDLDATSLLGSCYTELYQETADETFKEKGEHFLSRASAMLEAAGFSAVIPSFHQNLLSEASNDAAATDDHMQKKNVEPRLWLIKLSAANFNAMRTTDESELWHITRPMGETPKPGDLVFFAGDDYLSKDKKEKNWRLAAVYSVASDAKWHPINGFEHSLQMVSRPEMSIPIAVHDDLERRATSRKDVSKSDPYFYGIYELDFGALDTITGAIREYNDAAHGGERIIEEIHRMKRIS
jgi:hypothetical protein